ncbi:hypothetical protein KY289_038174 [Solanum tuberosum]|nr:hypothetical protein KY289_038174 [Solanum tuberosum]
MAESHISPVNISITSNKGNIFCNHNSPHETMGQQVAASTQAVKLALVTVSADGQRAIVEDTLKESTSLTDVAYPEQNDSYSTTYTTRYRRSRHHDHFKKFATKEESLQNIPTNVNEAEWKFLVDYFSSDDFKRNTHTGKEPNFQKLWEITHMKTNGDWVTSASAEVNDKMKDVVAEKIQRIEEGTDVDPIINAAFVQIMGEKSKYILGPGFGIKPASKISRNEIQEQLQAQQKEAKEERRKRESVENKQMEVKNKLEEERKN